MNDYGTINRRAWVRDCANRHEKNNEPAEKIIAWAGVILLGVLAAAMHWWAL